MYMSLRFVVSLVLTKEEEPWSKMKIHSRMPLPASSLGNVPVLVLGDFNIKVERSPILAHLMTSGRWSDIGQTCPTLERTDPAPTFEARGNVFPDRHGVWSL